MFRLGLMLLCGVEVELSKYYSLKKREGGFEKKIALKRSRLESGSMSSETSLSELVFLCLTVVYISKF